MQESSNFDRISGLFEANGGYVTRRQVDGLGIPSWFLTDFVRRQGLEKIDKGFYADQNWLRDDYLVFQYKYPKFIFSFGSALFLQELTDSLPPVLEVTGPRNYRPFSPKDSSAITHTDYREEIYSLGITEVRTNIGNTVRTYDTEKTICDLIRRSGRIDPETYIKALRRYSKSDRKDTSRLMEYAAKMGMERKVSDVMMVVLNED